MTVCSLLQNGSCSIGIHKGQRLCEALALANCQNARLIGFFESIGSFDRFPPSHVQIVALAEDSIEQSGSGQKADVAPVEWRQRPTGCSQFRREQYARRLPICS
jgi:hypothetical protein